MVKKINGIKLIVTGGYGFIGSHFVTLALDNDIEVLNLDKITYAANPKVIKQLENLPKLTNIVGDISDDNLMSKIFDEFKPDGLINFAAETHVDNSIANAEKFISTNIVGTHNMLKTAVAYLNSNPQKQFKFIQVSTDEVFGSLGTKGTFNENSPISPRNPYSATKAAADHLVSSWYNTYSLPTIISNCSNNFGPYQDNEKLIPKTIKSIIMGNKIKVYGNGKNVRDWLYVKDHALAILKLFKNGRTGERYCIGGGQELSNIELVNLICEIADDRLDLKSTSKNLIEFVSDRPGHDFRYAIDDQKIRSEIQYSNKNSFQKSLLETVEWYLDHFLEENQTNFFGEKNGKNI